MLSGDLRILNESKIGHKTTQRQKQAHTRRSSNKGHENKQA